MPARPTSEEARAGARAWLSGLRDQRADKLNSSTSFPFAVDGIGPVAGPDVRKCKAMVGAKNAAAYPALLKCLFADKVLMDTLPMDLGSMVQWKVIEIGDLPPAFGKKKEKLTPLMTDHALVQAEMNGDGMTYTLILVVKKTGAAATVDMVLAATEKHE
ncbi:MAG: hypothetical protein EXR72_10190 [Myxococcales bacterium]|nr:hypothetical protein [Myxococcales bacterium]